MAEEEGEVVVTDGGHHKALECSLDFLTPLPGPMQAPPAEKNSLRYCEICHYYGMEHPAWLDLNQGHLDCALRGQLLTGCQPLAAAFASDAAASLEKG